MTNEGEQTFRMSLVDVLQCLVVMVIANAVAYLVGTSMGSDPAEARPRQFSPRRRPAPIFAERFICKIGRRGRFVFPTRWANES
jgi:hypothetical protein